MGTAVPSEGLWDIRLEDGWEADPGTGLVQVRAWP